MRSRYEGSGGNSRSWVSAAERRPFLAIVAILDPRAGRAHSGSSAMASVRLSPSGTSSRNLHSIEIGCSPFGLAAKRPRRGRRPRRHVTPCRPATPRDRSTSRHPTTGAPVATCPLWTPPRGSADGAGATRSGRPPFEAARSRWPADRSRSPSERSRDSAAHSWTAALFV